MNNKIATNLLEDTTRFASRDEAILKAQLIKTLKDDGKGHHHAYFAKMLRNFDVEIVYYNPNFPETYQFTAAMYFNEGKIRISEGFLSDPDNSRLWRQLNVLLRHELAHYLMNHQIRMTKQIVDKYGKDGGTRIEMSSTLHELSNIIADFEISNRRYTQEDKITVKYMWLNGELIGGLVTDTDHSAWKDYTLEQMYESLLSEIENLNNEILAELEKNNKDSLAVFLSTKQGDFINRSIMKSKIYSNTSGGSIIGGDINNFKNTKLFRLLNKEVQKDCEAIINEYIQTSYKVDDFDKLIKELAASSITTPFEFKDKSDNVIATAWTPEEKMLFLEILKNIRESKLSNYQKWYEKVLRVLGQLDEVTLKDILSVL